MKIEELDTRNLIDEFKGWENEEIKRELGKRRNSLEIAIYNVEHDFNAGSIVRTANSFNVAKVHIVGRRKYNRRGAMCTDKYMDIMYWQSEEEFVRACQGAGKKLVAIENNTERAKGLGRAKMTENTVMMMGSEGGGLSEYLLTQAEEVWMIESFGSTRSVNVGVAAGIAMYEWVRQCVLEKEIDETRN